MSMQLVQTIISTAKQSSLVLACQEHGVGLDEDGLPAQVNQLGRLLHAAVLEEMRRVCQQSGVKAGKDGLPDRRTPLGRQIWARLDVAGAGGGTLGSSSAQEYFYRP